MRSLDSILENLAPPLGPLERQVHHAVWSRGSATVREVIQDRTIWQRYSTILTTMERLFRKGLLSRVQEGKAFRYSARYSPEELERLAAVRGIRQLDEVGARYAAPFLFCGGSRRARREDAGRATGLWWNVNALICD